MGTLRAEVLEFLRALLWIQHCWHSQAGAAALSPGRAEQELGSSTGACLEHFLTRCSLVAFNKFLLFISSWLSPPGFC